MMLFDVCVRGTERESSTTTIRSCKILIFFVDIYIYICVRIHHTIDTTTFYTHKKKTVSRKISIKNEKIPFEDERGREDDGW